MEGNIDDSTRKRAANMNHQQSRRPESTSSGAFKVRGAGDVRCLLTPRDSGRVIKDLPVGSGNSVLGEPVTPLSNRTTSGLERTSIDTSPRTEGKAAYGSVLNMPRRTSGHRAHSKSNSSTADRSRSSAEKTSGLYSMLVAETDSKNVSTTPVSALPRSDFTDTESSQTPKSLLRHALSVAAESPVTSRAVIWPAEPDESVSIDAPAAENSPEPRYGFLTQHVKERFLQSQVRAGLLPESVLTDERINSLQANPDISEPLYFWQIYSLTGRRPIRRLVERFYKRVFEDKDAPWFKAGFESTFEGEESNVQDYRYHITAQSLMYIDCFGGGRMYFGAEKRLAVHHEKQRASLVMNARGARQWFAYMRAALDESEQAELNAIDPRIRVAINTFLTSFMEKYAKDYDFDRSGVYFGDTFPRLPNSTNSQTELCNGMTNLTSTDEEGPHQ